MMKTTLVGFRGSLVGCEVSVMTWNILNQRGADRHNLHSFHVRNVLMFRRER
jgi:hypothetical protein